MYKMINDKETQEKLELVLNDFFHLLYENAIFEHEIKAIVFEEKKKVKESIQKKIELLEMMANNEFKMDHLKEKLRNLEPRIDEIGANIGIHGLDISKNDIELLLKISKTIRESDFAQPISDLYRYDPFNPCICDGCSNLCKGCMNGCTGCGGDCKSSCCWPSVMGKPTKP
jgi:hypothetical protein